METTKILTTFAPALICFVVYLVTSKFPPSIDNAFISKTPEWWARDQKTWDIAFVQLTKGYLYCTLALVVVCAISMVIDWEYNMVIGYVALIILMLLVQYRVRAFMQDKIK